MLSTCYTWAISEHFGYKALYKFIFYLLTYLLTYHPSCRVFDAICVSCKGFAAGTKRRRWTSSIHLPVLSRICLCVCLGLESSFLKFNFWRHHELVGSGRVSSVCCIGGSDQVTKMDILCTHSYLTLPMMSWQITGEGLGRGFCQISNQIKSNQI